MKIAVTADVHLSGDGSHPERFNALEDILGKLPSLACRHLIISGDLFDRGYGSCSEFDELCSRPDFADLQILVIPGNHDENLSSHVITASNVRVFTSPALHRISPNSPDILFVPYEDGITMGQRIAELAPGKESGSWILVGHGDYMPGTGRSNRYEPGVYMPLTGIDIQLYSPSVALLGHIHKPYDSPGLYYPGSPCGLDINETGRRRFLVLDTDTLTVDQHPVTTDVLYFQESFLVIPSRDEIERLESEVQDRIQNWDITDEEKSKTRIRIEARGFTADRSKVLETLQDEFRGFEFADDGGPDLTRLLPGGDNRLEAISEEIIKRIEKTELPLGVDEPDRESVIEDALKTIYGG